MSRELQSTDERVCPHCHQSVTVIDTVGLWLMYDCHAFRPCVGRTIREVVADWQKEHDAPGDHGPPCLCPVSVLDGERAVRKVGPMVHALYGFSSPETRKRHKDALRKWIKACESDPDIPRLLAAGRTYSEVHKND